jgi:dihydropyrimidinase
MTAFTLAGGVVVTPWGAHRLDVEVSDGLVAALSQPGRAPGAPVDIEGCYVLPGGVDPHCHLLADIGRATRAAALGGTTTALSFTLPRPGEPAADTLARAAAELEGSAYVDVGLHAAIWDPDRLSQEDLERLRSGGVSGLKLFLAYPELGIMCSTRRLAEILRMAAPLGQVVQVHCECAGLIEALSSALVEAGRLGPRAFVDSRPAEAEQEAVYRALMLGSVAGARCYLTHLSTAGALDHVRARRRHQAVAAEACLHHLVLDDRAYQGPDAELFLVCPPLRGVEHVRALWEALADGTIDAVGSDHAQERARTPGCLSPDGSGYSYGLAGIEARLPLLLSEGLQRGLSLERLVHLASAGPAMAFGHYPAKGAILPGAHADLVVWDPGAEWVVPPALHDGTGATPYAGRVVRGAIRSVYLRGQLIADRGELVVGHPTGRFQPSSGAGRCSGPSSAPSVTGAHSVGTSPPAGAAKVERR